MNFHPAIRDLTRNRLFWLLLPLLYCHLCAGFPAAHSNWFSPALLENHDSECQAILRDARQKYFSGWYSRGIYGVDNGDSESSGSLSNWSPNKGYGPIEAYGKTFFLYGLTHPGCGGGCERYQPLVSGTALPQPTQYPDLRKLAEDSQVPATSSYTIATNPKGIPYLFQLVEQKEHPSSILVHKLSEDGRWRKACLVSFSPATEQLRAPQIDKALIESLASLERTVSRFLSGGENCGSLRTRGRWRKDVADALTEVLYRPWTLPEKNPGVDADGSFLNDMHHLQQWALFSVDDFNLLSDFTSQLSTTSELLSTFYQQVNGWTPAESRVLAEAALKGAVSRGIRFYAYQPGLTDGEEALRRAILEGADITAIKAIEFDSEWIDAPTRYGSPESRESILNIAVNQPETLAYLLQRGIPADNPNAIGKTPLMYAAQNNQLASAQLLINHGADTNATTVRPIDTCYYSLKTVGVTPLHYATRFASTEMVRLLLDHGASTSLKATSLSSYAQQPNGYPIDWLRHFTGTQALERNPYIEESQLPELEHRLAPLSPAHLADKVNALILEAEAMYQEGNAQAAFRTIALAARLDPENQRALSDLSLIALRSDHPGQSAEASRKLIASEAKDSVKANGWFNLGLACINHPRVSYNGNYPCRYGALYAFEKAFQLQPTDTRRNKIRELFEQDTIPYCLIHSEGRPIKIHFQRGYGEGKDRIYFQTIYVFHDAVNTLSPEELAWTTSQRAPQSRIVPRAITTIDMDDKALSIFRSESSVPFPYKILGETCNTAHSR